MLIYISYSSSDFKLYKSLRDQCEAKGFTIVTREKPFEFGEVFSEKGKHRIELASVAIILLTAFGRSSYRVFRETAFITSTNKDHFIIEGFGKNVEVRRKIFDHDSPLEINDSYLSSLSSLEKLINEFSAQLNPEAFN